MSRTIPSWSTTNRQWKIYKRKNYKCVYIAKKYEDPSYQQEKLLGQHQYTKESGKKHMHKRQNVHKINSSRSDICNTEHNIISIQEEECGDINSLGHLPQRGEKSVIIKQILQQRKERTKQVIPQRNQM